MALLDKEGLRIRGGCGCVTNRQPNNVVPLDVNPVLELICHCAEDCSGLVFHCQAAGQCSAP